MVRLGVGKYGTLYIALQVSFLFFSCGCCFGLRPQFTLIRMKKNSQVEWGSVEAFR